MDSRFSQFNEELAMNNFLEHNLIRKIRLGKLFIANCTLFIAH